VEYGIIADDLTGACDVAGRLIQLGYRPIVRVRARVRQARRESQDERSAVLVVNARSRAASLNRARTLMRLAVTDLVRADRSVVYYKMDSTLRGHWPDELSALDSLLRPTCFLICPAFPARGRPCRNGCLVLRREEWQEFRHSQPAPWSTSLEGRLREELGHPPRVVRLELLRQGQKAVRASVDAAKTRYILFDATRERDLEIIGESFRNSEMRFLWVGSAGLARYVFPRPARPESGPKATRVRPWLLVQGSRQRISHEQFRGLEQDDSISLLRLRASFRHKELTRWIGAALDALAQSRHVAISVPKTFSPGIPVKFANFVGNLLQAAQHSGRLGGIFVSGGHTAEALCDRLRVSTLQVVGEVRPGIARSLLVDGRLQGMPLITKAGGFGKAGEVREILKEISS
jgi:uncharacterized protein YgbK (DUF1537 family)